MSQSAKDAIIQDVVRRRWRILWFGLRFSDESVVFNYWTLKFQMDHRERLLILRQT